MTITLIASNAVIYIFTICISSTSHVLMDVYNSFILITNPISLCTSTFGLVQCKETLISLALSCSKEESKIIRYVDLALNFVPELGPVHIEQCM